MRNVAGHGWHHNRPVDTLVASVFLGIIGTGYVMYGGGRRTRGPRRRCPACVFPYFVDSLIWTLAIGASLLAVAVLHRLLINPACYARTPANSS